MFISTVRSHGFSIIERHCATWIGAGHADAEVGRLDVLLLCAFCCKGHAAAFKRARHSNLVVYCANVLLLVPLANKRLVAPLNGAANSRGVAFVHCSVVLPHIGIVRERCLAAKGDAANANAFVCCLDVSDHRRLV